MTPRIPPLPLDQRDAKATELLAATGELNIFTTLVRHPRLFRHWSRFGGALLTGELPARERELLILRVGHRCDAPYELAQHRPIARAAGLRDEEIARVAEGPDGDGWSPLDAALLRAADELHDTSRITDATWATLAEHLDDRQLIEVCMVVGQYHLVSFTLNSLGVEIEAEGAGSEDGPAWSGGPVFGAPQHRIGTTTPPTSPSGHHGTGSGPLMPPTSPSGHHGIGSGPPRPQPGDGAVRS